ncbi:urease subunit gamma/beta [Arboricoccus pini]|uniref:urease n=2 Tax=Arboricoccus pini TaxID=1963835 RepID=A0A212S2X5_9PROT|nr:urease subunit beta [Arboricoccus pini]SNB79532.1 urease subunit gamma/beta [Arboricoccus pini]
MMNLAPTEMERLIIFNAAQLARTLKTRGCRLSQPEAVALIADEMLLGARMGMTYEAIVEMAGQLLTTDDVMPGVARMIEKISVEANFEEGTKMVIVFDPIATGKEPIADALVPGEVIVDEAAPEIELNAGRPRISLDVVNLGDRDIQVRSHTHFFEVNRMLQFDRAKAFGMRLDAASGSGVRFEPGLRRTVQLVPMAGNGVVRGQGGLTEGAIGDETVRQAARDLAKQRGYQGA